MTLNEALRLIDGNGTLAAKRPNMAGYVTKAVKTETGDDGAEKERQFVVLTERDGEKTEIPMDGGACQGGYEASIAEFFAQFVIPDDWAVAPAEAFETARGASGNRF